MSDIAKTLEKEMKEYHLNDHIYSQNSSKIMKFDKSSIGKSIYITGCSDDNICAKCCYGTCISSIKDGKIFGIIHELEPTNENDPGMSRVHIMVGNTRISSRRKWCHSIEDDIPSNNTIPENIIELQF